MMKDDVLYIEMYTFCDMNQLEKIDSNNTICVNFSGNSNKNTLELDNVFYFRYFLPEYSSSNSSIHNFFSTDTITS